MADEDDVLDVDGLRSYLSTWLTIALGNGRADHPLDGDLLDLRDWIDGGCEGERPYPTKKCTHCKHEQMEHNFPHERAFCLRMDCTCPNYTEKVATT